MKLPQAGDEIVLRKTYWVDANWLRVADGTAGASSFTLGFRRNTAGEARRLADKAGRVNKRGMPKTPMGELVRERVMLAVGTIEGLDSDDGTPIERITPALYDRLPEWLVADAARTAAGINGLAVEEDDDDEEAGDVEGE